MLGERNPQRVMFGHRLPPISRLIWLKYEMNNAPQVYGSLKRQAYLKIFKTDKLIVQFYVNMYWLLDAPFLIVTV